MISAAQIWDSHPLQASVQAARHETISSRLRLNRSTHAPLPLAITSQLAKTHVLLRALLPPPRARPWDPSKPVDCRLHDQAGRCFEVRAHSDRVSVPQVRLRKVGARRLHLHLDLVARPCKAQNVPADAVKLGRNARSWHAWHLRHHAVGVRGRRGGTPLTPGLVTLTCLCQNCRGWLCRLRGGEATGPEDLHGFLEYLRFIASLGGHLPGRCRRSTMAPLAPAPPLVELRSAMSEAALVTAPALALLVPNAESLFVEYVSGAELLLTVSEGAVLVVAPALVVARAEPRLVQVRRTLQLSVRVCEGAIVAALADTLQVEHAHLGLTQLRCQARALLAAADRQS
mmetsp:Transcript_36039/g.103598  ORF Transcript_36039/g.103598 Transcript_36039/m.103598 type:complete len:343 (-) Transcript_36039:121-1149(-)